jgi:cytochrome c-type biogenesis protein CcmH/NrfG
MLRWSGEIAAQIPTQTMALMRDRLMAEASTAAWQDYFWFNAWIAIICLFPALPYWRRTKYQAPAAPQTAAASAHAGAGGKGDRSPKD